MTSQATDEAACPLCERPATMSDLGGFKDRLRIAGDLQARLAAATRRAERAEKALKDEITDDMVWAGVAELGRWPEGEPSDFLVRKILEAALRAR